MAEKHSRFDDEPTSSAPTYCPSSVGVDGGLIPGYGILGQPPAAPSRTAENFVCLRGPCRHYWHLVTMAQEGNPEGTWDHLGIPAPRQHHHTCLVNPGFETDFADDNAFECSKWDPTPKQELIQIKTRRDAYFKEHPEHAPLAPEDEDNNA